MIIQIDIVNKRASVLGSPVIICGNSDYTVKFTFDAEWSVAAVKTARFVYLQKGEVKHTDVVFSGTEAKVPILSNVHEVRVGVYEGDLHTTTPALVPCERSIRCGTGAPEDPTPSQYDQIIALLNSGGGGSGGISQETDPTVPAWAKQQEKPTYTASEVGADPSGTAQSKTNAHNVAEDSHNDIRLLISGLTTRLNALANSTDDDLDQMAEIVAYIKSNKDLIDGITTSKVSVADIIDNLTTNVSNKPLSAKMGVELKKLVDAIKIPTSLPASDVYDWAKQQQKPSYSKSEIGLGNVDNVKQYSESNPPPYPVTSVNGKAGAAELNASDVGARPSTWTPTHSDVGADKSGTAAAKVSAHNTSDEAHSDIRLLIEGLTARLNALANSTDDDLDQMAEIVAYIKSNKSLIDEITTKKVNVSDIANNLTTNMSNRPLSAAQGVALKALIDAITVPTKVSELANDEGYLKDYTESDPTVPAWAKEASKPKYSASEVGADPAGTAAAKVAALPKLTMVGTDADGVEHTWTIYGS